MNRSSRTTAADVYKDHEREVEKLSNRDDEIGAIFRALKIAAGKTDE